jgi:hypothetical protein
MLNRFRRVRGRFFVFGESEGNGKLCAGKTKSALKRMEIIDKE